MSKSRGTQIAPDELVRRARRRRPAAAPDVPRPLGPGRTVERARHRRHGALHPPRLRTGRRRPAAGPFDRAGCRRRRPRRCAGCAPDDPAGDDGSGRVPVQHDGRRADRVRQRADAAARTAAGPHPGVARGAGDAGAADGAEHAVRGRGAVGAAGHALLRPPADVAGLRPGADARRTTVEVVVQVNGKVRDRLLLPADLAEDEAARSA